MTQDNTQTALVSFTNPEELRADVMVDITDITGCMQKQASLFVHYASQTVKAKRQYERMKAALEILESSLDAHYRKALVTTEEEEKSGRGGAVTTITKTIKPTEPQIKAAICQDIRWKKMSGVVIDAQQIWRLAEVAERSFEHRKDVLLQIARDAARESSGQLRLTANQANRDRVAAAMANVGQGGTASEGTPPWQ
jgi:hypothetical protein